MDRGVRLISLELTRDDSGETLGHDGTPLLSVEHAYSPTYRNSVCCLLWKRPAEAGLSELN